MISLQVPRISSDADAKTDLPSVRAAVERLLATGAIVTLSGEPRPILVGACEWRDARHCLLFAAHGDAVADAHAMAFDEALVNAGGSVTFLRDDHVVGALHAIDDADVDDPDDYRIAWQLWEEVAPMRQAFIERCFAVRRVERR